MRVVYQNTMEALNNSISYAKKTNRVIEEVLLNPAEWHEFAGEMGLRWYPDIQEVQYQGVLVRRSGSGDQA